VGPTVPDNIKGTMHADKDDEKKEKKEEKSEKKDHAHRESGDSGEGVDTSGKESGEKVSLKDKIKAKLHKH